jgi:hypothetical protein
VHILASRERRVLSNIKRLEEHRMRAWLNALALFAVILVFGASKATSHTSSGFCAD